MSSLRIMSLVLVCGFLVPAASAQDEGPVWRPDATSPFEVGTQLRPWTIRDEGMDTILENMSMAGINNIYLIVVMHEEMRPFHAPEFPHNPVRDRFQAEDSTVAFFPEMSRYGRIKPALSDYDWMRETDWLAMVVETCRSIGLGVGAEVSHFPIPKALVRANPDWQQKTIDGQSWQAERFCPNHPDVREYLLALFGDLAANYDLDYIQTCQHLFNEKDIDEGGTCFCAHCMREAARSGFDLRAAAAVLTKDKNARPERDRWLAFRRDSTTKLYREISAAIRRENPRCHLRLNDVYTFTGKDAAEFGLDFRAVAPHLGSVVNQDHQEQRGLADETFEYRKRWLATNRRLIGPDKPLISGIAARMKASPELVRTGIKVAVQHPAQVDGLALKHYDGASFSLLRAFKQGMIDAGVRGLTPTIGREVEEMELDGYSPFRRELVEEWGVETEGTGTASYVFDGMSGTYDIRVTYFDETDGQSRVALRVARKEVASFRMDEDTGCWRGRRLAGISVSQGDMITLVGTANGKERARLDFLELIPSE